MILSRKDWLAVYGCLCLLSFHFQPSSSFVLQELNLKVAETRNTVSPSAFLVFGKHTLEGDHWNSQTLMSASSKSNDDDEMTPFAKACAAFEAAHAEDPTTITIVDDAETNTTIELPYSVQYHRRMAHWLDQLSAPDKKDAPETVQLAARCQHIRRWTRPRADYPKGLVGYKNWRQDLNKFHADEAAKILTASGYDDDQATAKRVEELLRKKNLTTDPEVQLMEDVICVVFLENEYDAWVAEDKYDDDKMVDIVQKTWGKMTPRGHEAALALAGQFTERGLNVVTRALEE